MSSPGWLERLINSPYTPLGAVGLMVALAGFGVYRHKQRNKVQSSILGDHFEAQTPGEYPVLHEAPEMTETPIVAEPAPVLANPATLKRPEPITLAESIDLELPDLDIFAAPEVGKPVTKVADLKPRTPPPSSAPIAASVPDMKDLDFDLAALSLDLNLDLNVDEDEEEETTASSSDSQDPLETKLALAHEFSAIGDKHGARALIEEVIAEASGAMKTKAKLALSQLQVS